MSPKELSDIRGKQKVFAYAREGKNVSKAYRHFGISQETYYQWKKAFEIYGEKGLINSKPCPENPKLSTPEHIEELILPS